MEGNNILFTTKLNELSSKIKEFEKEIIRLVNTDFTKLFKDLQQVFIDRTRKDLEVELKRFEEKSKDIQSKIDDLKKQVGRLESIDLEKHFSNHQKILSEIFVAINAINLTLTGIIQTLNNIIQSLGTIQVVLKSGFEETNSNIKRGFGKVSESIYESNEKIISNLVSHINAKSKEIEKHFESQDEKLKSLSGQNDNLKKEVKTNRIIQIIGLTIISIILFYLAIRYRL